MIVKVFNRYEVLIYERVCRNAELKTNPNMRSWVVISDTLLDEPDTYIFVRETDLVTFEMCREKNENQSK